jgi:hypothetical protein
MKRFEAVDSSELSSVEAVLDRFWVSWVCRRSGHCRRYRRHYRRDDR